MSNFIEMSAKTVEEAIDLALDELKIEKEMAEIEVIEEGAKGIFGFIGTRMAKVKVTKKMITSEEVAQKFLENIFEKMNVEADMDFDEDENNLHINVTGEDVGILIGRRGETLESLQYLTSLVVNKETSKFKKVALDIENYRKKREDTLVKLATRLADRVVKYKKSITLEPMSSYERRVIHATLQDNVKVNTFSVGDEPYRKIVIKLSK
jgi:spoIIIJ-associated protein